MITSTFVYFFFGFLLLLLIAGMDWYITAREYSAPVLPAVPGTTKIACVGDSITFGALIKNRKENCYPAQLGRMLAIDIPFAISASTDTRCKKKRISQYLEPQAF